MTHNVVYLHGEIRGYNLSYCIIFNCSFASIRSLTKVYWTSIELSAGIVHHNLHKPQILDLCLRAIHLCVAKISLPMSIFRCKSNIWISEMDLDTFYWLITIIHTLFRVMTNFVNDFFVYSALSVCNEWLIAFRANESTGRLMPQLMLFQSSLVLKQLITNLKVKIFDND